LAVGAVRQSPNRVGVPPRYRDLSIRRGVPDLDRPILAPRGDPGATRGERGAERGVLMPRQGEQVVVAEPPQVVPLEAARVLPAGSGHVVAEELDGPIDPP